MRTCEEVLLLVEVIHVLLFVAAATAYCVIERRRVKKQLEWALRWERITRQDEAGGWPSLDELPKPKRPRQP